MSNKRMNGNRTEGANRRGRNICVYCGSGVGNNPAYGEAARTLGASLAAHDIGLVYGGGSLGLMGEIQELNGSVKVALRMQESTFHSR